MADPQVTGALEAEPEQYENDSSLGEPEAGSSTTSIRSSILKYREENGRTYHAYKDGAYLFPNDEKEADRLDLQHHLFNLTFENKLFIAPIPKDKPLHRVLDAGTGTGIWAIDFADEHLDSQVFGIDLSPIQPSFVPPNLEFQVDDLEAHWSFSSPFDFIYARMMVGSFASFPRFIGQAFENITPGGYLEMVDICFPIQMNDGAFPEDSALRKWSDLFSEACTKLGRPANSAALYKEQFEAAGFTNVVEKKFIWPQNQWPKDKKMKELGMWYLENMGGDLEGLSVGLFTRVLGWEKLELDAFLAKVRSEMKDTKLHAYWDIYVVYGEKP
ncbi:S-adenosyl-L-methionine-dependent methyltransferase-6 [Coleophoma cylindrospora]|uniref:S-adenosyl-L-methionine-dependent methyltransferase-6 n=1 Tax=Coleophoma cylindrospora TaxID=1849047 RepID=A0A3D8R5V7_9HELO|nr:S-adenosyl-L-methionine-dependent methyltransferase-6 [Coleophoma cylindrospora]